MSRKVKREKGKEGYFTCPKTKTKKALDKRMLFERRALDSALHLAAAQAAGAYGHAGSSTVHQYANLLGVRSPGAARLAIGVANIVAVNDALVADFTEFAHYTHLLQEYIASKHNVL